MRLSRVQVAIAAASGVAATAYLVSLVLTWVVAGSVRDGLFGMLGDSSAISSLCGVLYLLLTVVALGVTLAAGLSPIRWYAVGALLVAVADLAATVGIAYRINHAHGLDFGPGWYVAAVAVLAACTGASFSWVRGPVRGGP
jgi:hypothetical protein